MPGRDHPRRKDCQAAAAVVAPVPVVGEGGGRRILRQDLHPVSPGGTYFSITSFVARETVGGKELPTNARSYQQLALSYATIPKLAFVIQFGGHRDFF